MREGLPGTTRNRPSFFGTKSLPKDQVRMIRKDLIYKQSPRAARQGPLGTPRVFWCQTFSWLTSVLTEIDHQRSHYNIYIEWFQTNLTKEQVMNQSTKKTTETKKTVGTKKYDGLPTKSAKIRAMTADGFSRSQVANALGIRYQHVRNVLVTPLKRSK